MSEWCMNVLLVSSRCLHHNVVLHSKSTIRGQRLIAHFRHRKAVKWSYGIKKCFEQASAAASSCYVAEKNWGVIASEFLDEVTDSACYGVTDRWSRGTTILFLHWFTVAMEERTSLPYLVFLMAWQWMSAKCSESFRRISSIKFPLLAFRSSGERLLLLGSPIGSGLHQTRWPTQQIESTSPTAFSIKRGFQQPIIWGGAPQNCSAKELILESQNAHRCNSFLISQVLLLKLKSKSLQFVRTNRTKPSTFEINSISVQPGTRTASPGLVASTKHPSLFPGWQSSFGEGRRFTIIIILIFLN